jgi:hypothetical protein
MKKKIENKKYIYKGINETGRQAEGGMKAKTERRNEKYKR